MQDKYKFLFDSISKEKIIITSNDRLDRSLSLEYLKYSSLKKKTVVSDDIIFSLKKWTDFFWAKIILLEDTNVPSVISEFETYCILKNIIKKNHNFSMLHDNEIKEIYKGWILMHQWELSHDVLNDFTELDNTKIFKECCKNLDSYLIKHNMINVKRRLNFIINHNLFSLLKKGMHIYFIGFDTRTPTIESMIQSLNDNNITSDFWSLPNISSNLKFFEFDDNCIEIKKTVQSIQDIIKTDSSASIGIIVPDLQIKFDQLQQEFDNLLLDDLLKLNPLISNNNRAYNISGGTSIYQIPIVYQFFQWIKINTINDYNKIALLLTSSYLSNVTYNKNNFKKILLKLKKDVLLNIDILFLIDNDLVTSFLNLDSLEYIKNFLKLLNTDKILRSSQFVAWLRVCFKYLGWGNNPISKFEYQVLEKLNDLLNEFCILDRLNFKMSIPVWIDTCIDFLKSKLFQTKNRTNNKIHILGLLESTGLYFDHMFIINMNDKRFPSYPSPNRYLPYHLQRKYSMPRVSLEKEYGVAQNIFSRLMNQSLNITVSYSKYDNENFFRPSPFIMNYSHIVNFFQEKEDFNTLPCIRYSENYEKKLGTKGLVNKNTVLYKKGVEILKNISECPYRSVLIHRLGLNIYQNNKLPLNALEKGIILHSILEAIWKDLKNVKKLRALTQKQLVVKIHYYIVQIFKKHHFIFHNIPGFIKSIEEVRIQEMLLKWFELEKKRNIDFDVLSVEKKINIIINGMKIRLRIDRIDQLADGKIIIIDYKTSKNFNIRNLLQKNITEVQLPIYAVYEKSDAISIALVNNHKCELKSISSMAHWIESNYPLTLEKVLISSKDMSIPKTFKDLKNFWKKQFEEKIFSFKSGNITITPSHQSCQYCKFDAICCNKYY